MTIALLLTVIAAIAGAISAAARTYTKLKPQAQPFDTVQEAKSQEAEQPRLQPDLDSEQPESVKSPTSSVSEQESVEAPHPRPIPESSTIAIPPMMPIAEADISLATSLRISDVVDSDLSIESKPEAHHAYSVIDEVGQLDHFDERLHQLQHQATDSHHLVRLSVAVELGELAKQGQAIDQVVTLLNQLTQDADLEVRVQAGTALAMVSVETTSD